MLWRAKQNYPFTFWKSVSTVGELRESLFYLLGTRVQVTLSPELISLFSVLQRGGHQGEMGSESLPPLGCSSQSQMQRINTDTGRRARNQADGADGEQQPDRWHGNTDSTRNLLGSPLTPHGKLWKTFYLFRNHLGMTLLCFPSHPKCFWTTP